MHALRLLAIDLGGESGRAVLGRFDGDRLSIAEAHRFPNVPVERASGLHWNTPLLLEEIANSIRIVSRNGVRLDGIGIDTWGVDYGLLDSSGALIDLPFHYRDRRTEGMVERAHSVIGADELYAATGCQTIPINTFYQLLAHQSAPSFERAERMLLMPDLFNYWLSGEVATERTIASTTQLYDPVARDWAVPVIARLGLPVKLIQPIQPPGTIHGSLKPAFGPRAIPVIAVGSHDTASAFAAVTTGSTSLVISSGTWSLIGIETAEPIITPGASAANLTNEAGVCDTNRFLKNVAGMWLIQECRRSWAGEGKSMTYDELTALASASPPGGSTIDLDDPRFIAPGDMPERIRRACVESGQTPPEGEGMIVRCILESLALKYRWMVELVERVAERKIEAVQIIGGGARNALHCQLAANATGLPVYAGPVEATAIGNIMVQALALGAVHSLAEIRDVIVRSFTPEVYEPIR